ncbi:hypothetical protein ACOMHN_000318 [Nucella lapillus]
MVKRVELLNTANILVLGWTTYKSPKDPVEYADGSRSENKGWFEASFSDPTYQDPQRIFASCNVRIPDVNNWVRTPFIDRSDAISVSIEVRFSMRRCSRLTDPNNLQQCKETFNLYYYESNDDYANDKFPTWDTETYTLIDKVAADYMWETTSDKITINTERRSVTLNPNIRGVYFAFQDEGSCVNLISVRVFYITCPKLTVNFAIFKEVPTGTGVEEYNGVCVPNSVEKMAPSHFCETSGKWYREPKGQCVCMPGYSGNVERTECTSCPRDYYKWSEGSGQCQQCPPFSHSSSEGSSQCTCQSGYYRAPLDDKARACTRPPSAPRNLLVHATTSSSITLNWDPPADHGSRSDLEYRISCAECGNQVLYRPGWHGFNTTSVTITNLNPSSSYRLIVYAENGVSNMSGSVASAFKIARTEASAKVIGLRRVSSNANRITIAWELPASMVGDVTQFKVRYFPDQREDIAVSKYTTNRNLTVTDFELDTAYIFLAGKLLIHHSDMEQATFSVRGGAQTGSMVRGHGPCGPHTSVEAGGAGL